MLITEHRLSADEAGDIKSTVLAAARISTIDPHTLTQSLIDAFELIERTTAEPVSSARNIA